MKYIKRINSFEGMPTTYAVFRDQDLIRICGSKKEAEKVMENA